MNNIVVARLLLYYTAIQETSIVTLLFILYSIIQQIQYTAIQPIHCTALYTPPLARYQVSVRVEGISMRRIAHNPTFVLRPPAGVTALKALSRAWRRPNTEDEQTVYSDKDHVGTQAREVKPRNLDPCLSR